MKTWLKQCSVLFIVALLIGSLMCEIIKVPLASECILCNCRRYHAPCLIDLRTGTIMELSVYDPHPTITGELAEEQYTTGIFSLISCGGAQGYRDTTAKKIEIRIPIEDLEDEPELCALCIDRLPEGYTGRYILADLYDQKNQKFIEMELVDAYLTRCYSVLVVTDSENFNVVIQGMMSSE